MHPQGTIVDTVTRIYKNSAGRVIGIHCLSIEEGRELSPHPTPGKITNTRFKRHAKLGVEFLRLNLSMGENRTISTVQMIGKYDDFTYNGSSNDIVSIIYFGDTQTNELEISLSELPTVGDTI
jgi:hypothetical protein